MNRIVMLFLLLSFTGVSGCGGEPICCGCACKEEGICLEGASVASEKVEGCVSVCQEFCDSVNCELVRAIMRKEESCGLF